LKRLVKPLPLSDPVYEAARIHLDDLEEIVDRFRGAELNITLSDGTYEYDTLDELKKRSRRTS
jgi:hypothetical protein